MFAAAALIFVAGAAIRIAALSTSIWFDEAVSVRDISGSFGQMLHRVISHEASPPLYFICLWLWRHLVGSTVIELRALSALAGTLTIALAFYVARRRVGERAALILALFVAVSPALVYYSSEMRMYGLLVLLTGIGFEAFLRASESPNRRNLSLWAGASILALWTQYYAALAVAPEAVLLVAMAWKSVPRHRGALLAVGGVAVGGLPLIYLMPYQASHAFAYGRVLLSSSWQRVPLEIHSNSSLAHVAGDLLAGPGGPGRAVFTLLILLMAIVGGGLLLRYRRPAKPVLIRGVWLFAPAFVVVVTLVDLHLAVEGRYLLPLWLPAGLAATYAILRAGRLGLGFTGVLVCIWVGMGVASMAVPKFATQDDTGGAARSLGVAATDRLIAIDQTWDVLAFNEYRPQASANTPAVVRVRELDVVAMPVGGEPPPSAHPRPSSIPVAHLPQTLRLAQVIRGSTFLVERFVSPTPVSIRVDGHGHPFSARFWRFLTEPAGGRIGSL